jgi:hypothetical protein
MSPMARAAALIVAISVAAGVDARAQENLDRDKSGPKLFAASCVECHKSARGLAKGRMSFTLSYYLRQHYTSSAQSAQTLTAYLQSVDTPPAKAKRAAPKSQPGGASASKPAAGDPQTGNTQTSKAPATKSQARGGDKGGESRLPIGTISEDPRVKPPAAVPGR